jgi:hypothetical protein
MLAKIEFHEIDSWNLVGAHPRCMQEILEYESVCYFEMARTHFLKLERLQYRGLRIALGLMQSTPNNSLGVLSGVSPLAEKCMYLNYRYLVTVFHKHGHIFETENFI